ncbi:imidazole glycerol phosphate synthase subunit HisH [SAR202 cluster bacterium AD-812-D07_MRT_10900m]|nr:imidazole glycerol phosphate synthase subunit HisH [SAR202 cluster bacterium AD-812-D07_MRT_10900m]
MIGVIDYGRGNLLSVSNALDSIGQDVVIVTDPDEIPQCDRIVLPGVGAFPAGMRSLNESGLIDALTEHVVNRGKPFLGICLGMQLLATVGHEMNDTAGLGWIDAEVSALNPSDPSLKLPHVGWNETVPDLESPLFKGLGRTPVFYYVHSYAVVYMNQDKHRDVEAWCDYGGKFAAAIQRNNIVATQFHPEKSQDIGLRFLMNWVDWNP